MTLVKLLKKVRSFSQDGVVYRPGDVFELKGRVRLDFMVVVPEPVKAPVELLVQEPLKPEEVHASEDVEPVADVSLEVTVPVETVKAVKKPRKKTTEALALEG